MSERPSWDEYFRDIVLCTSLRSPCTRLKVGCILVKENRIVSQGYNGFLSGHPHHSIVVHDHEISTIHAEQNAIIDCAKRGVSCKDCHVYITHFPCIHCLKMLVQVGAKKIFYIYDYKNDHSTIEALNIDIEIIQMPPSCIIKMPNEMTLNQSS